MAKKKKLAAPTTGAAPMRARTRPGFVQRTERIIQSLLRLGNEVGRYEGGAALCASEAIVAARGRLIDARPGLAQIPADAKPASKKRASKWVGAMVVVAEEYRPLYDGTPAGAGAHMVVEWAGMGLLRCAYDGRRVIVLTRHAQISVTGCE